MVLKLAAYKDRGAGDPFASHDLEDVLALLASRPGLVLEVEAAPPEVREFIGTSAAELLGRPDIEDLLAAHLNNAQAPEEVVAGVRGALAALAGQQPFLPDAGGR